MKNGSGNVPDMYPMHCSSMKRPAKIKLNVFLTFWAQIKEEIRKKFL